MLSRIRLSILCVVAILVLSVALFVRAQDTTPEPTAEVTTEATAEATAEVFTRLDMNTATGDQFLAIPGMNNRMVREYMEYRPYVSILQFRKEIGKYVGDEQVAAWEPYIYVPIQID